MKFDAASVSVKNLLVISAHCTLYNYSAAPSGFPRGVSISTITSESVELLWSPPLLDERNGIITGYWATLTRCDTGSQIQLLSLTTSIIFNMLNPFTSYSVTISASTAIGLGPQSTQLTFSTAEDGTIDENLYI